MKEKIFQKLKQEFSHLGLGDVILQAHADSLSAIGLVTDENINTVISAQKGFLENLQKTSDKRVTDAVSKAKADAKKELETEEARKKAEEETKKLEEQAKTGERKGYAGMVQGRESSQLKKQSKSYLIRIRLFWRVWTVSRKRMILLRLKRQLLNGAI